MIEKNRLQKYLERKSRLEAVREKRAMENIKKQQHPERFMHPGTLCVESLDRRDYDSKDIRYMDDDIFEKRWKVYTCCGQNKRSVGCK